MKKINSLFLALVIFGSCQKADLQTPLTNAQQAKGGVPGKPMLTVGSFYGGGVVVYLDETGQHGLIAALEDVGPAPWGCAGTLIPEVDLGYYPSGELITAHLAANCNEPGSIIRIVSDLVIRDRGDVGKKYDDWFMPNGGEMAQTFAAVNDMDNEELTASFTFSYWLPYQWGGTFQAAPVDPSQMAGVLAATYYGTPPLQNWIPFLQWPQHKSIPYKVRPMRTF